MESLGDLTKNAANLGCSPRFFLLIFSQCGANTGLTCW